MNGEDTPNQMLDRLRADDRGDDHLMRTDARRGCNETRRMNPKCRTPRPPGAAKDS